MTRDLERIERLAQALRKANLEALVCALPCNVLLLSGYWPVTGTAVALVNREGTVAVLAPHDEEDLARSGWANEVTTFEPGSLKEIRTAETAVREPLRSAAARLGIDRGRVGYESGPGFEPASYASCHYYGAAMAPLLRQAIPGAEVVSATGLLEELRSVKTAREIDRIRTACTIAGHAFEEGARQLRPGLKETEAAGFFRTPLSAFGTGFEGILRADGFAFCMAGADSAQAFGAYARSRANRLREGDLVLTHCNSAADGYWTDITRTYCLGPPSERQRALYDAVFAAREAALAAIRPGVRAADVDRAARDVLKARGFGSGFKHPTGHGVGFAAIDHNARPRLHPCSEEVLEAGMICNVEPAVYIEGYGGLRHYDVVAVTPAGCDLLTSFQAAPEALWLG